MMSGTLASRIFNPGSIKGLQLKNRLIRSSMGGRNAYYDGTINPAWTSFERRFAEGGVAAIISATVSIDDRRSSPLEYPKISDQRFVPLLTNAVAQIKDAALAATGEPCRYILQIGDPGSHTQTSLLNESADSASASWTFDFLFGYRNASREMSASDIDLTVANFAAAARRVQQIGCDGVEVTASKGYLIHQFLNPLTNRRKDEYGGSVDKRFRLLERVIRAVRDALEPRDDFILGVRLSASDFNWLPFPNPRLSRTLNPLHYLRGNGLPEAITYAQKLEGLGVDYLHIDSGFGFINPKGNPGALPIDELRIFCNAVRHLSAKAAVRAALFNAMPNWLVRLGFGWGWTWDPRKVRQGENARYAAAIKRAVGIPVIANGGFRDQAPIEAALARGDCDFVSMARALLSNPKLPQVFRGDRSLALPSCTFCNRCAARTALFPLGCYDISRYRTPGQSDAQAKAAMEKQIGELARP